MLNVDRSRCERRERDIMLLNRLLGANELIPFKCNRGGKLMLIWGDCKDDLPLRS